MLCTVVPIWMIGEATEYWQFLVLGLFVGLAGGPEAALYVFIVFYLTCIVTTWWYYSRKSAEMPC